MVYEGPVVAGVVRIKDSRYQPVIAVCNQVIVVKSLDAADPETEGEINAIRPKVYITERYIFLAECSAAVHGISYPVAECNIPFRRGIETHFIDGVIGWVRIQICLPHL